MIIWHCIDVVSADVEFENLNRNQYEKLVMANKNIGNISVTISQRQTLKVFQQVIECAYNGNKVVRSVGWRANIAYEELEIGMSLIQ